MFIELGNKILKKNGILAYITSNQFITTEYGRLMRRFLIENKLLNKIVDFGDLPLFENALTYVSIFFIQKSLKSSFQYTRVKELPFTIPTEFSKIDITTLSEEVWTLGKENKIQLINKLEQSTQERLMMYAKCWTGVITGKDDILMFDINRINKLIHFI